MRKRSISINGHRTSVLLEPEFWFALEEIARARGASLSSLIAGVDAARLKSAPAPGLASALRVFILAETADQQLATRPGEGRPSTSCA